MQLDLSAWLALSHGDRIALSVEGDPGTLSYRELDRLAQAWADRLEGMGVGPGDRPFPNTFSALNAVGIFMK